MIFQKAAIPVIGTMIALGAVNAVESMLPVVALMKSDPVSRTQNYYTSHVTGYKIKECIPVPGTFVGWRNAGGVWVEGSVEFLDDMTPDSAKPKSYNRTDFGLWRWSVTDDTEKVKVTVIHICNGHPEITTVGPFTIGKDV